MGIENDPLKEQTDKALREYYSTLNETERYFNKRQFDKTIQRCDKFLADYPNSPDILSRKSAALYLLQRYEEAIQCLDKVLEIDPNAQGTWKGKAFILLDPLQRYEEAIECYDRALEIKPDDIDVYYNKGFALFN